jgi:hypothetical protein
VEAGDGGCEFAPTPAHGGGQHHAIEKAAESALGGVEISMCVEPDDRGRRISQSGERADATDAVAGSHQGEIPATGCITNLLREFTRDQKGSAGLKREAVLTSTPFVPGASIGMVISALR